MTQNIRQAIKAAKKVKLVISANPTIMELYGYFEPVLDEKASLRRVSLFAFGSGKRQLSPDERYEALQVLDDRFNERFDSR